MNVQRNLEMLRLVDCLALEAFFYTTYSHPHILILIIHNPNPKHRAKENG